MLNQLSELEKFNYDNDLLHSIKAIIKRVNEFSQNVLTKTPDFQQACFWHGG
jgi:hypothetical protein